VFVIALAGACFPATDSIFPPRLDVLIAWASLFPSVATFRDHLDHLKLACVIGHVPTSVSSFFFLSLSLIFSLSLSPFTFLRVFVYWLQRCSMSPR
jgi:hypothetical protein